MGFSQHWLVNLLGFQTCWWLSILFTSQAIPALILLLALHLAFHRNRGDEFVLMLAVSTIGFTIDSVLTASGLFVFTSGEQTHAPVWLGFLWLAFAATLRQGLQFFHQRYYLAALAGAISGSGSYIAAAGLGAVSFGLPFWQACLVLIALWAILFPLLMHISTLLLRHDAPPLQVSNS